MCESDTDKRNPTCPHCTALVQFDKARIFSIFQSWKIWPKSKRGICLVSKNFTHFCLWDICLGSFWHFLPISWKYFFLKSYKRNIPCSRELSKLKLIFSCLDSVSNKSGLLEVETLFTSMSYVSIQRSFVLWCFSLSWLSWYLLTHLALTPWATFGACMVFLFT